MGSDPQEYLWMQWAKCDCRAAEAEPRYLKEIEALKKKIEDMEAVSDRYIENIGNMIVSFVNAGDWYCQHEQFLKMILNALGKKSWRLEQPFT